MPPSFKATRVFLPWFTQSDLIPKAKYLHLKFGFQCTSLLPVFNNILEDYRLICLEDVEAHLQDRNPAQPLLQILMTLPRSLAVIPLKEKQYIAQLWNVRSNNENGSSITN